MTIQAFGGDPSNTTVMRESAVGRERLGDDWLAAGQGLMHKAVSPSGGRVTQSPSAARNDAPSLPRALPIDDGKAVNAWEADQRVLNGKPEEVATCLRAETAADMIRVPIAHELPDAPAVLLDGDVIPAVPQLAIATGAYDRVLMRATNTCDEGERFGATVGACAPSDRDRLAVRAMCDPERPTTPTRTRRCRSSPAGRLSGRIGCARSPDRIHRAMCMSCGVMLSERRRAGGPSVRKQVVDGHDASVAGMTDSERRDAVLCTCRSSAGSASCLRQKSVVFPIGQRDGPWLLGSICRGRATPLHWGHGCSANHPRTGERS